MNPLPLYIDSTMIVTFRQCPQKFFNEYIQCLRPKGRKVDLVAGGAFAAGLEAAYVARIAHGFPMDSCLAAAYRAFAHSWGDFEDDPASGKSFNRTFQAILYYFEKYPIDTDPIQPMLRHDDKPTVEFSFAIPLDDPMFPRHPSGSPFLYAGRFDSFGIMDGQMVIRDEKTTGKNFSYNWSDQWNLRNQFLGYMWAARRLGWPVTQVVIRGLLIQKTQFNHTEAFKLYSDQLLDRFASQLARDLYRLCDNYSSGYFDYDLGDACFAFGRPCSFMQLCETAEDDRAPWYTLYDRERWNPIDRTSNPVDLPEGESPCQKPQIVTFTADESPPVATPIEPAQSVTLTRSEAKSMAEVD